MSEKTTVRTGSGLLRRTSIDAMLAATEGEEKLQRSMSLFSLTMMGVGATIGTGIFVVAVTVPEAGPGVLVTFLLSCLWAATQIPPVAWLLVGLWLALALVVHFTYSRSHSVLAPGDAGPGSQG